MALAVRKAIPFGLSSRERDESAVLFPDALDSLRITSIATALTRELGFQVPIRLLFDCRTVGDLIAAISRIRNKVAPPESRAESLQASIRRRNRKLSFAQERMAFMHALSVGSAAYHVAFGLRLRGPIDQPALSRAIESLPRYLEVLRTRFLSSAHGIVPMVVEKTRFPLRLIDAAPGESLQVATEFSNAPFDLEAGDTARAALIREDAASALLVFALHHIVVDQWSYELLLDLLARLYAAELHHKPPAPDIELAPFFEYAQSHRSWFRTQAFHGHREYWVNRLAGARRVSFDTDRPRPNVVSFRGARRQLALPEQTWQQLEAVASRERATLAMLLFAALGMLLRNHSGCDDLVIGLPVANRNHRDSLACFGSLVNTLAVRIALVGEDSFARVLREVRRQFLDAFDHQDLPFEILIGQLHLERDPGLSPLFGVMLNMLNTPPADFSLPGIAAERVEIDRCGAQFDLTLTVDRYHTRSVWFEYATDLYSAGTIDRIMARYAALLDAILEDPGRTLNRMPQRTRREATDIRSWSLGSPELSPGIHVYELFAGAATTRLDQCAVRCGLQALTYGELQRRAAAVAAGLRQLAPQSSRVGLMLGRSTDLPVALLGALLAGVTFVPLDPTFPDERLAYIAVDAGLKLILTDSGPETGDSKWVPQGVVMRDINELASIAGAATALPTRPDDYPAYVIYTSGTTGHPKGVEISAHALANFLHAMRSRPGISETDRLLAVTTLSFDISLLELLLPLTVGAQVIIASREQARDGDALAELIQVNKVTLMQGTPSTWFQLLESDWQGSTALRALVGGEPLPEELARRLQPLVNELWNMYGPTETTVWSSCARIDDIGQGITIGTPIAGTTIEIVDGWGRPAGIGIQGEIVIGGAGLATQYLGRPELTSERFQNLALDGDRARYYRTGDIGRWTGTGQIRIQGRSDRQVKLRGYRIEPGEIEASALRIPGIRRALVTTHAESLQDVRLALYVVPNGAAAIDPAEIRGQLKAWLPDYMIPQLIVAIDSIPELPNGKVDLRRLAQLAPSAVHDSPALPPQSQDEVILHSLWRELLGIERIDRDQDFFELGGHSLLAMRLVTSVRQELQKHCTLAQVFQNPTIASLCAVLSDTAPLTSRTLVALQTEGDGVPLFCICGVQLYRPLVAQLGSESPVFATFVPMVETLDVSTLAREYLLTIRAQQHAGPYRLMGFSLGGVLAYEIAQQLRAEGEDVLQLIILDSDVPGEAATSPIRGVLQALRRALGSTVEAGAGIPDYVRAIRAYRPAPYPGRAIFVRAMQEDHFEPGYGWEDLIVQLSVIRVQAEHLALMSEERVAEWAPAFRRALVEGH